MPSIGSADRGIPRHARLCHGSLHSHACVAAALSVIAAAPAAGAEYFPVGQVFRPLAADPAEPRSCVVRRDQGHRGRTGLQAGIDYAGTRAVLAGGRLVGGVDVKWFGQTDWDAGVSAKIGLEFGRPRPERRGLTVSAEAYDGFAPFVQFTSREVRYYGAGLQFDF